MAVVKVICKNLKKNPHCPHGPTLRFSKIQDGIKQEYFACSAYRDRKDCSFYITSGKKLTEETQRAWALERHNMLPDIDHAKMEIRLNEVKEESVKNRLYCHTCSQLDLISRKKHHYTHSVQTGISNSLLSHPSQILKPKEGSKMEAQFLFAKSTTQVIVDNLYNAGVTRVLCLGTPRVHEHIQDSCHLQSLLLDLDERYHSFWPSDRFIWYNMFNHHMLSEQQDIPRKVLLEFLLAGGQVALVMDPPFGGHVEPLAATINYFRRLVAKNNQNDELLVIWVFPYFRERHIIEKCPSLLMMDYKVQYDNHKQFKNGPKGHKRGSPVRLFTNIDAKTFVLPVSEGYWFCNLCVRWMAPENKHCDKCSTCPSKDGRTYLHCNKCGFCVKPSWFHCDKCHRCLPTDHLCSKDKTLLNTEPSGPRHKRMKLLKLNSRRVKLQTRIRNKK